MRSLENYYLSNIAVVDLLPGGFEVVPESINNDQLNNLNIQYADVREDRVVFFGNFTTDTTEIIYKIRPTNSGKYTVPPIMAHSMYDPKIVAKKESKSISVNGDLRVRI